MKGNFNGFKEILENNKSIKVLNFEWIDTGNMRITL